MAGGPRWGDSTYNARHSGNQPPQFVKMWRGSSLAEFTLGGRWTAHQQGSGEQRKVKA